MKNYLENIFDSEKEMIASRNDYMHRVKEFKEEIAKRKENPSGFLDHPLIDSLNTVIHNSSIDGIYPSQYYENVLGLMFGMYEELTREWENISGLAGRDVIANYVRLASNSNWRVYDEDMEIRGTIDSPIITPKGPAIKTRFEFSKTKYWDMPLSKLLIGVGDPFPFSRLSLSLADSGESIPGESFNLMREDMRSIIFNSEKR